MFQRIYEIIFSGFMSGLPECCICNDLIDIHINAGTGATLYSRDNEIVKVLS